MAYRCPVCRADDPYHYVMCQYPGCPDGRMPTTRQSLPEIEPDSLAGPLIPLIIVLCLFLVTVVGIVVILLEGKF